MKRYLFALAFLVMLPVFSLAQTAQPGFVTIPPSTSGAQFPIMLYNVPLATGHANISATTLLIAPATGTYEIKVTASLTDVGASCAAASTEAVNLIYQDPNAASAQTKSAFGTFTSDGSGNGTKGTVAFSAGVDHFVFRSLAGKAIQVSTTYTAGMSCSPGPNLQITPLIVSMGQ